MADSAANSLRSPVPCRWFGAVGVAAAGAAGAGVAAAGAPGARRPRRSAALRQHRTSSCAPWEAAIAEQGR